MDDSLFDDYCSMMLKNGVPAEVVEMIKDKTDVQWTSKLDKETVTTRYEITTT